MQDTNNSKKRRSRIVRFTITDENSGDIKTDILTRKWKFSVSVILFLILYSAGLLSLVYFTPLKKTIPGYPDIDPQEFMIEAQIRQDSIANEMLAWNIYLSNIDKVLGGEPVYTSEQIFKIKDSVKQANIEEKRAQADSTLRSQVLEISHEGEKIKDINEISMFCPIKGIVTARYNLSNDHPYIDIAAESGTTVFAILPGTIISDEYSDKYGYSIQIQHEGDLVSVYRHNNRLIRRRGEKVEAGTPIATIGADAGDLSDGPHLHFELWYKGEPINPELYINF